MKLFFSYICEFLLSFYYYCLKLKITLHFCPHSPVIDTIKVQYCINHVNVLTISICLIFVTCFLSNHYKSILLLKIFKMKYTLLLLLKKNAGPNSHFQHFCYKKPKKSYKFAANFSKKQFFSLHQNAGRLFYSQK